MATEHRLLHELNPCHASNKPWRSKHNCRAGDRRRYWISNIYVYIYIRILYKSTVFKNYMFTIQVHLHSRSLPLPYGYGIFPVSDFPLFLWTGNIMGWQYLVSLKRSSGPSKQSCFALQPRICSAFSNLKTSQNSWWRIRIFMEDYVSQKWFPNVSGQQWSWNINITSISTHPEKQG